MLGNNQSDNLSLEIYINVEYLWLTLTCIYVCACIQLFTKEVYVRLDKYAWKIFVFLGITGNSRIMMCQKLEHRSYVIYSWYVKGHFIPLVFGY